MAYEAGTFKRWNDSDSPGLYVIFMSRGVDIEGISRHTGPPLSGSEMNSRNRATSHLHPWYELQQPQEGHLSRVYANPIRSSVAIGFINSHQCGSRMTPSQEAYHNDALLIAPSLRTENGCRPIVNSELVGWWLLSHLCSQYLYANGYLQAVYVAVPRTTSNCPLLTEEIAITQSELEALTNVETQLSGKSPPNMWILMSSWTIDYIVVFEAYGLSASERKLRVWIGWGNAVRHSELEMPQDWRRLNALRASAGSLEGQH